MAINGINSKAVQAYLQGTRGAGITPSFSDRGPEDSFYNEGTDIELDMDPTLGVEDPVAERARKEKEERELLQASWRKTEEIKDLEDLRKEKDNLTNVIGDMVREKRLGYENEFGIPQMSNMYEMYIKMGQGANPNALQYAAKINQARELINYKLNIDADGNPIGTEAVDFQDYTKRFKDLETREKTLILDDQAKRNRLGKDYTQELGQQNREEALTTEAMVARGLTNSHVAEYSRLNEGKVPTGREIAVWDQETVRFLKRSAATPNTKLAYDAGTAASQSPQTRALTLADAKDKLLDNDYQTYERLQTDWAAKAQEAADSIKVLSKAQERQLTNKKDRAAALIAGKETAKRVTVQALQNQYKSNNLTIDSFNPVGMNLDTTDALIAQNIYSYLLDSYGKNKKLDEMGFFELREIRSNPLGTSAVADPSNRNILAGYENAAMQRGRASEVYRQMIEHVANMFNAKHSEISGVHVTATDSIISRFK